VLAILSKGVGTLGVDIERAIGLDSSSDPNAKSSSPS
jgi:hypothetical protein